MNSITRLAAAVGLALAVSAPAFAADGATAPAATPPAAAPKAGPLVVFDPANFAQAVLQLVQAYLQVQALYDQLVVQGDILEMEQNIWDSQTKERPHFAGLVNNVEQRMNLRRYMPTDWNCAMSALNPGGCQVGEHQNQWLDHLYETSVAFENQTTEQLMERYGAGAMLPTQQAYMDHSMGATNAAMASALAVQDDVERRTAGVEDMIEELRRGQTHDIQGMMALNSRINAENAIAMQTMIRLQAQSLYMQGLQQQESNSDRIASAQMLTAFPDGWDQVSAQPVASED